MLVGIFVGVKDGLKVAELDGELDGFKVGKLDGLAESTGGGELKFGSISQVFASHLFIFFFICLGGFQSPGGQLETISPVVSSMVISAASNIR